MSTAPVVQKVWNFCHTLRDDGVGYGDYLEQITYLIFLKMADEYARPPYNRNVGVPTDYAWPSLHLLTGSALEAHYLETLRALGARPGMLGQIFTKAQNKIQDPAKLARLVGMINEDNWAMLGADVKGDIYEGLLERNAEDTKSGAGQYFTPRALIRAMVDCVAPEPGKSIADPACGTGGFFLSCYDHLSRLKLDKAQKFFLKNATFIGNEIVANTRRLCLMNMFLHNIGEMDGASLVSPADALVAPSPDTYDYVLANPPFGKKSSMTFTTDEGEAEGDLTYNRQDFWATTSNKQLNFVQHIRTMLKTTGRAAVVVPDNVLFEGGAGETIRRKLLAMTDLHTILRLPTGIFYAQGVKANVIFRQPRRVEAAANPRSLVLRLPHQHSPHAEKETASLRRPRRVRGVLQPRQPSRAQVDLERGDPGRPMAQIHARRAFGPRQGEPRYFLAQGQEPDRPRQPARAGRPGRGDHREHRGRIGEPEGGSGEPRIRRLTDFDVATTSRREGFDGLPRRKPKGFIGTGYERKSKRR
jgi:type I restriction enzyme M protein